jgi:hypothetical protein
MATLYHIDQCHYVAMQNIYQISCMPFAVICPFCRLTFAEQPALTDKRQRHVTLVHLPKWHTIFQRGSKDFHDIEGRRCPFSSTKMYLMDLDLLFHC